jgi:trans-aconitate 2-methyltransferase
MSWSASKYTKFEDERNRPVRDLIAAIPTAEASRALDLGCGPGNSTEVLMARYPTASITGIDSAEDMVRAARERLPSVAFELADIATWQIPSPWDVIIANAVLHWVPAHEVLLPRLVDGLSSGGSLAVQMPDNLAEPSHVLMQQVANDGPWAAKLAGAHGERSQVAPAAWYYGLLQPRCARVDVWRTTYHHPLAGVDAVVEWFKGSASIPSSLLLMRRNRQNTFCVIEARLQGPIPFNRTARCYYHFHGCFSWPLARNIGMSPRRPLDILKWEVPARV